MCNRYLSILPCNSGKSIVNQLDEIHYREYNVIYEFHGKHFMQVCMCGRSAQFLKLPNASSPFAGEYICIYPPSLCTINPLVNFPVGNQTHYATLSPLSPPSSNYLQHPSTLAVLIPSVNILRFVCSSHHRERTVLTDVLNAKRKHRRRTTKPGGKLYVSTKSRSETL